MDNKKEEGPADPRSRYVWDPNKLAWVETVEEPTVEEPIQHESAVAATLEESLEDVSEGVSLVEAVAEAEGLQYKGAFIRGVAFILDFLVMYIIGFLLAQIVGTESPLATYALPVISVIYFVGFWAWRGQTPGKIIINAKVVRTDGSPIGLGRAFLRYIVYLVWLIAMGYTVNIVYLSILLALIMFLIVALNKRKRGLWDMVAGTVVIDTRPRAPIYYAAEEELDEAEQEPDSEQT